MKKSLFKVSGPSRQKWTILYSISIHINDDITQLWSIFWYLSMVGETLIIHFENQKWTYWRLPGFFDRKSRFFQNYGPKDSSYSCYHFHTKFLVVGGHLRRRNPKKRPKNATNYICFVSHMTEASSESSWSEVSGLRQTKCGAVEQN